MGEVQGQMKGLGFNRSIRIEAVDTMLTSNAGALLLREAMERSGLLKSLSAKLVDKRDPDLVTHPLSELLATRLCLLALGHLDQDDSDAFRADAGLRLAVSKRAGALPLANGPGELGEVPRNPAVPRGLASQPTQSRLMASLAMAKNRGVLHQELAALPARVERAMNEGHRVRQVHVDIDSLPINVFGEQPGSAYNGHYHHRIYHPLVATVGDGKGAGSIVAMQLRDGNVGSAEGCGEFALGVVNQLELEMCQVAAVRMDAGMPSEEVLSVLEHRAKPVPYAARVKNNAVLDRMAEPHLRRPPGRRPISERVWFHELEYRAGSWSKARRVVLVVIDRPGELYLHHFWLITNWTKEQIEGSDLLEYYRQRGSGEGYMGELKSVLQPALSSSPRSQEKPCDAFAMNEATLLLNGLAYNVMNLMRRMLEARTMEGWSIKRLRERALRVAGRVTVHARRPILSLDRAAARFWRWLVYELTAMPVLRPG
jgi:hypothetical protein